MFNLGFEPTNFSFLPKGYLLCALPTELQSLKKIQCDMNFFAIWLVCINPHVPLFSIFQSTYNGIIVPRYRGWTVKVSHIKVAVWQGCYNPVVTLATAYKGGAQSFPNAAFNLHQRYSGTHLLLGEQWTFSSLGQIGIRTCYHSYRSSILQPLDQMSLCQITCQCLKNDGNCVLSYNWCIQMRWPHMWDRKIETLY